MKTADSCKLYMFLVFKYLVVYVIANDVIVRMNESFKAF